jgi:hypothetical protein
MLRHLARAFALRALGIRRVQCVDAGNCLELELTDVRVDDREALLPQHHAVGQAQSDDITVCAPGPWTEVSDRNRQGLEGLRPVTAE